MILGTAAYMKTRLRDIGEARIEIARIESGVPDGVVSSITVGDVGLT